MPKTDSANTEQPSSRTTVIPLLTTTDWNEEWKALQIARAHPDDASEWNERSKTFPTKHGGQFGYVEQFLALADIRPGETVLDMGCGTGALATPLAQAGHRVIAADFAQGMLDVMCADQDKLGVTGVTPVCMSWSDDWEAHGIGEQSVDVALASRSIMTADLEDSLMRLTRTARRRAFITLSGSSSPRVDARLIRACGFHGRVGTDFLYAFNILASLGYAPEVSYIPCSRTEYFGSYGEMLDEFVRIVKSEMAPRASDEELSRIEPCLSAWLPKACVEDERGFHLPEAPTTTWAFIAWNTR